MLGLVCGGLLARPVDAVDAVDAVDVADAVDEADAAEGESFGAMAKSIFEKAIATAKSFVSGRESEKAEAAPDGESDAAALESALKAAMAEIFHKEGEQYFTQSRWGAEPAPYEVMGLELVYLGEAPATADDRATGIDRRVTYEFRASQHRRFHQQTGWGRWLQGAPPHLESIMLAKENGTWKVASSPLWAYSVK